MAVRTLHDLHHQSGYLAGTGAVEVGFERVDCGGAAIRSFTQERAIRVGGRNLAEVWPTHRARHPLAKRGHPAQAHRSQRLSVICTGEREHLDSPRDSHGKLNRGFDGFASSGAQEGFAHSLRSQRCHLGAKLNQRSAVMQEVHGRKLRHLTGHGSADRLAH